MNTTAHAVRLGLARGWIEFKNSLTNPSELVFNTVVAVGFVLVLYFQRDSTVPGTSISLSVASLPSMIGMLTAFGGLVGTMGTLAVEREDGTLLRAKAMPHGMVGYLVSRVIAVLMSVALTLIVMLGIGLILLPELRGAGLGGWLTVAWVAVFGLLATLPWGAVIGSLAANPQIASGLSMIVISLLTAISGIFYPISALPGWLQAVSQLFPVYWLGLGMRSALLPDGAAAVEIGESWRHLETLGVLGAWAVAGLLLAPPILRRMARRESGSLVQARRERATQRVG